MQAIEDFQRALELEPEKEELAALLRKAETKYLEVEGVEYHTRRSASAPTSSTSQNDQSPEEVDVEVEVVDAVTGLLLPPDWLSVTGILTGECVVEVPRLNGSANSSLEGQQEDGKTRIAISIEDEEEEEEEGEEGESGGGGGGAQSGFVRINIDFEEDDEEGEGEDNEDVGKDGGGDEEGRESVDVSGGRGDDNKVDGFAGFTRIPVTDDGESDEDEEEGPTRDEEQVEVTREEVVPSATSATPLAPPPPPVPAVLDPVLAQRAVKLKSLGNDLMQAGRHSEAARAYDQCLGIDPTNWAALSNRALANLKLQVRLYPCPVRGLVLEHFSVERHLMHHVCLSLLYSDITRPGRTATG